MAFQTPLSDTLRGWIRQTLAPNSEVNSTVLWYLMPVIMPDQNGNPVASYMIVLSIPDSIVGRRISTMGQIPFDADHSEEAVAGAVGQLLDALMEQRSASVTEPVRHLPSGSLILPGR